MNQDQTSRNKLVQEIEASNEVIDMLELWLNKAKEVEAIRDHITVVEPSGGTSYKKILITNLNPGKIRNV